MGAHTGGAGRVLEGLDTSAAPAHPVSQTNHGALAIGDGAGIITAGGARLVNASDGLLQMEPGTSISAQGCCAAPDRLTNDGVFSVLPTSNGGPVVLTGISYRSGATTEIASGRTLTLTGGAPGRLDSATVNGGGRLTSSWSPRPGSRWVSTGVSTGTPPSTAPDRLLGRAARSQGIRCSLRAEVLRSPERH
jgi:hypothetical protein